MNKTYLFLLILIFGTSSCSTDRKENLSSPSQTEVSSSAQLPTHSANVSTKAELEFQSFLECFPPFDYPFIWKDFNDAPIHEELPKAYIKKYFFEHYATQTVGTKIYPIAKRKESNYWIFLARIILSDETMPIDGIIMATTTLDGCFIQNFSFAEKTDEAYNLGYFLSQRRHLYYSRSYYCLKDSLFPERSLVITNFDTIGEPHPVNSAIYSPNYPPLDSIYQNQ